MKIIKSFENFEHIPMVSKHRHNTDNIDYIQGAMYFMLNIIKDCKTSKIIDGDTYVGGGDISIKFEDMSNKSITKLLTNIKKHDDVRDFEWDDFDIDENDDELYGDIIFYHDDYFFCLDGFHFSENGKYINFHFDN